ncbi:MAG TPA: hypothetical protein VKU02_24200 [Gemmataceae bacterium]|nr:hypothetical protein [Gemmataceae bacterium]
MIVMLVSLAFLAGTVFFGFTAPAVGPGPVASPLQSAKTQNRRIDPAAETADRERDCLEERDNSDESSSSKLRAEESRTALNRYGLVRFGAKVHQPSETLHETLVPLFYALCRLLI